MNRPAKFFTELKALCKKYKVSIEAVSDWDSDNLSVEYIFYGNRENHEDTMEVHTIEFNEDTDIKELLEP